MGHLSIEFEKVFSAKKKKKTCATNNTALRSEEPETERGHGRKHRGAKGVSVSDVSRFGKSSRFDLDGRLLCSSSVYSEPGRIFSVSLFALVQWAHQVLFRFPTMSLRKLICMFHGITCRLKITNRFVHSLPSPETQRGFGSVKKGKPQKLMRNIGQ